LSAGLQKAVLDICLLKQELHGSAVQLIANDIMNAAKVAVIYSADAMAWQLKQTCMQRC
jgi:hypothetical protein